jgi:hypothetical protein
MTITSQQPAAPDAIVTQSTLELAQPTAITSPIMTEFTLQLSKSTTRSSDDVNIDDLKPAAKPAAANTGVAQSAFVQARIANAILTELQLSKKVRKPNVPRLSVHSIFI